MDAPLPIRKLDETVVNRIAAGEVIQRPANALKELLENSLDAKSTNIQVTVKDGGIKYLQIQDNGIGIAREDLEIVCERFTTSKLTKFEDLTSINTYGFRGEALASISHVAHLAIVTKTATSQVGYKALYEGSKLKGPPKPCAANQGTTITVEDLFFNIATRRKSLTNFSEEHGRISEVVSKYAIHNPTVGFTLKKLGTSSSELRTRPDSNVVDNIRTIYGNNIAKEVLEIKHEEETLQFKLHGYITNANFSSKKFILILFINHRLVHSSGFKKMIEQIYSNYLTKGSFPFVYLSLDINPKNVDVNIHPTKYEVHFLHEDLILDKTKSVIENTLINTNSSRVMYTQSKLPQIFTGTVLEDKTVDEDKKVYAHNMVRTDCNEQKLDKFFKKTENEVIESDVDLPSDVYIKREIKLRSILLLRTETENNLHIGLRDVIKNCTFVGSIDPSRCLIQHSTKLYLCDTKKLSEELFYQIILYEFANFGIFRFSNPISIKELVSLALDTFGDESGWTKTNKSKEEISNSVAELLSEKASMLEDYFSIEISDGNLNTLPLLLNKHSPDVSYLPLFVVRLATEVDWNLEQPCLQGISREIAKFYSYLTYQDEDAETGERTELDDESWKWTVEHVIIPALKLMLMPPEEFTRDGTVLEIVNLPDLYKVFERC